MRNYGYSSAVLPANKPLQTDDFPCVSSATQISLDIGKFQGH